VRAAVGGQIGVFLQAVAVAFGVGTLAEQSVAVFAGLGPDGAFQRMRFDLPSVTGECETGLADVTLRGPPGVTGRHERGASKERPLGGYL
jgi:hypothetical protein